MSRQYHISVFTAIFEYLDIKPNTKRSLKALETHLNNMRIENPQKAINRIVKFMGYGEYMERMGLDTSKISIMKAVAGRERSLITFLSRMEKLKEIIQNKKNDRNCQFIMSTIHGSKGLEYDNVYMIDVMDGTFPEEVPRNLKTASHEEIELYEEERRLFYVGVTRAKNNLFLFSTGGSSTFIKQFFYKKRREDSASGQTTGKIRRARVKAALPQKNVN